MMAGMSSLRRSLGLGLVLLAGCDGPSTSPTSAPATPVVAEVATPGVAEVARPGAAEVAAGAEGVAGDAAGLVGWWRSGDVCLELFANGDFELSDIDDEPKVMVMGQASVTAEGPGRYSLQLTTARIWKGRYVSSCRKHHELGDFVESRDMLGVGFTPGAASTLRLTRVSATQVELCGERCVTLTRATPTLVARWRRAAMESPQSPERGWQADDLLELDLDRSLGHVWTGGADGKFVTAYARMTVEYVAADRFTVTAAVERLGLGDVAEPAPSALGLQFAPGARQTLQVRRLAGERIEVCAAAGRCATLERQFDAYHHDLD